MIIPATAFAVLLAIALVTVCRTGGDKGLAPVLLFDGTGTSPGDGAAIETILHSEHLPSSSADSSQMNETSQVQISRHRLLIIPGGNFEKIGEGLTPGTALNIRAAVQDGLNYLGICAGAFFAGNSLYNGLKLTSGVRFGFYSVEARGIRKAPVAITAAGQRVLNQYWEVGPQLTGWGTVVAKYPDGMLAVVEGEFDAGG